MDRVRAHAVVKGLVQGVWFRASARDVARELGLSGWVRNLADGRVEAAFEGPTGAVDRALAWCRTGPPGARVESCEVAWEEPTGQPPPFEILRP